MRWGGLGERAAKTPSNKTGSGRRTEEVQAHAVILEAGCCQADYSAHCVLTAPTNRSKASMECSWDHPEEVVPELLSAVLRRVRVRSPCLRCPRQVTQFSQSGGSQIQKYTMIKQMNWDRIFWGALVNGSCLDRKTLEWDLFFAGSLSSLVTCFME